MNFIEDVKCYAFEEDVVHEPGGTALDEHHSK